MSRPSRNLGYSCPDNDTEYAIIGNTVAALMYVLKLRKEGVTQKIHVVTGIHNNLYNKDVESMDFIVKEVKTILHTLMTAKIHYVPSSSSNCPSGPLSHYHVDRCVHYLYGSGVLGDVISSPKLPNFGPWFHKNLGSSKQIQKYVKTFSTTQELNTIEQTVADRLNNIWSVPFTANVTVDTPSIACKHFFLKKVRHNKYIRELFKDVYEKVEDLPNVHFHNSTDTLYFEPGTTPGNYNIETRNWNLNDVKLVFKTNPYSFLNTAARGGLCVDPVSTPTFYRAVIPVASNGNVLVGTRGTNTYGINYSPIVLPTNTVQQGKCGCSLTTTSCNSICPANNNHVISENTFSLPDLDSTNSSNRITWAAHQYLTKEDYFPTNQTGWFAGNNYNLLIVEGICYDNKRNTTYSNPEQEIQVRYNGKEKEEKYLYQFARITCDVIFAYTGIVITPESILADQVMNVSTGAAMDSNLVENVMTRESSLTVLLEMIAGTFGHEYYSVYS